MGFLDTLGGALSTQLDRFSDAFMEQSGLAENEPGNLDHKGIPYGKFGEFAKSIDQTAHRSYIETGAIRNIRPRAAEILMQEPDVTVVVKKRLFSSLIENYRQDLMDEDEKLFLRASKRLFYNKCRLIAAYERLTKFEKVISKNEGIISDYALPFVFDSFDIINNSPLAKFVNNDTNRVIETLRKVKRFSDPQFFTTWNIASELPYAAETGQGTGTFDLTLVSSFNATNSVKLGGGSATISVYDPYKLMVITEDDIEKAIADATSLFKQNNFFRLTERQLQQATEDLKERLNTVRRTRNASAITFRIQENPILYKKIVAIIDEEGREIEFTQDGGVLGTNLFSSNDSIILGPDAQEGSNGLQGSEVGLFKQIVNNIYLMLGLSQTTESQGRGYNIATNNIRKKMMLHYSGKAIIQPMDEVNIFVSTKTMEDSKVTQGLKYNFTQDSLLNNINDTLGNIETSFNNIADSFSGGATGNSALEVEKNAIAGPEFPLWLYGLLRNDFTRDSAGTCVFSGLCDSATSSYSASTGTYDLNVVCGDKTRYFEMGQVNVNPSVEVFNGSLFDPLTPFKFDFEESSGFLRGESPPLLDANVRLLNSRSVRAKLGRFRGSSMDQSVFNFPDGENVSSGQGTEANRAFSRIFRKKLSIPDGFVYRWKEGIGSLTMFGPPHSPLGDRLGTLRSEASPRMTQNPFAGQDIMNVISLLVTGKPYNFNNFVRGALETANLQRNELTNEGVGSSFLRGLVTDLARENATWGNFIPFKKLIINERGYEFLAQGQYDLVVRNERLNKLLRERAEAFDRLTAVTLPNLANPSQSFSLNADGLPETVPGTDTAVLESMHGELKELDNQIREEREKFNRQIQKINLQTDEGTLSVFGDDISFDPSVTGLSGEDNESRKREQRRELRDRLNYLTRRRIWKVRGNEDPNLFIVDDTYDKNYDIRAFERALTTNLELFNSTYHSVFEQISIVSDLLDLEVFADSQGHIQARPPQYNRMPSSVYRDLLQKKAERGVQIFPSYLENLFYTNVQGLANQIEIVEDKIRLKAAALGATDDDQVVRVLATRNVDRGSFSFLTSRQTGQLSNDIRRLLDQDAPDLQEDRASGALKALSDLIKGPYNATINFNAAQRAEVALSETARETNVTLINNEIQKISSRLEEKTQQQQPSNLQDVLSSRRISFIGGRSQVDLLKVSGDVAQHVSERQRLIKRLANSLKNLRAGLSINSVEENVAQSSLLLPEINQNGEIPEIMEHMIENENVDDLGVGSGKRYVIRDSQIKGLRISENPPPFTLTQVDGKLEEGLAPLPSGLEAGEGGNGLATAWSIDYDLWRMYGFRGTQAINAPFFSNPNTQCAPYGVFLLNRARKNILQGEVSLVGNEFIQAGEVYYIEDRDLLMYAESVTHSYNYNSNYDTSLNLTYGHVPGAYIPTSFDIIGKALYSNRHQAELVRQVRHGRVDETSHLNSLIYDNNVPVGSQTEALKALVNGNYGEQNTKSLSEMLLMISSLVSQSRAGKVLTLELRVYQNSDSQVGLSANQNLQRVAQAVRNWVIDPTSFSLDGETLLPTENKPPQINPNKIRLQAVDLNPAIEAETRSPSSLAWSAARAIAARSNIPISDVGSLTGQQEANRPSGGSVSEGDQPGVPDTALMNRERQALVNSVIDVWVSFQDAEDVIQTSKSPTGDSQADQQEEEITNEVTGQS